MRKLFLSVLLGLIIIFIIYFRITFTSNDNFSQLNIRYYLQVPRFIKEAPKVSNDFYFIYGVDPDDKHIYDVAIVFKNVTNVEKAKNKLITYVLSSEYKLSNNHIEHIYKLDENGKKVGFEDKVIVDKFDNGDIYLYLYDYDNDNFQEIDVKKLNTDIICEYKRHKSAKHNEKGEKLFIHIYDKNDYSNSSIEGLNYDEACGYR